MTWSPCSAASPSLKERREELAGRRSNRLDAGLLRPAAAAGGGRTARRPPAGAAVAAFEVERRAGVPAADDGRGRGALPAEPRTSASAAVAAPWPEFARQP